MQFDRYTPWVQVQETVSATVGVTYAAAADGVDVSSWVYQWYFAPPPGYSIFTSIQGATSREYTIQPVGSGQWGIYRLNIRDKCNDSVNLAAGLY
jgi:hypothetical protein